MDLQRPELYPAQFANLSHQLLTTAMLWREHAFLELELPWERSHHRLATCLRTLDDATIDAFENDPDATRQRLVELAPEIPWPRIPELPCWPQRHLTDWPHGFIRDIPGRKWRQIIAFAAAIDDAGAPFLDWCAGKAHLGRALSQQFSRRPVSALEQNPALVDAARSLAARDQLPVLARCADVLHAQPDHLPSGVHAVALHACGALHMQLLRLAVRRKLPAIALAPCCYHLLPPFTDCRLSATARAHPLQPTVRDLRTAVQETVTAPGHARRRRARLQTWQAGFDLLRRRHLGQTGWQPIPAGDRGENFRDYCQLTAARCGLVLPSGLDYPALAAAAEDRYRQIRAFDLVRHAFRRTLEIWLVLDRLLFLTERGYDATAATFCATSDSPRNILIQATRASGQRRFG